MCAIRALDYSESWHIYVVVKTRYEGKSDID